MRSFAISILLVITLFVVLPAQEIRVKVIDDFSGGLMNSISNAAMRDNMAVVLENYDIDPFGNLRRRHGLTSYTSNSAYSYVYTIMPYVEADKKELLILIRKSIDPLGGTSLYTRICKCDPSSETCTTTVSFPFYYPSSDWTVPYNFNHFMFRDTLYFASANGEMVAWAGDTIQWIRRFAIISYTDNLIDTTIHGADTTIDTTISGSEGQLRALAINSAGSVKGRHEYVLRHYRQDSGWYQCRRCSTLSAVSWPVYTHYGTVLLYGLPDFDICTNTFGGVACDSYDSMFLYRRESSADSFLLLVAWDSASYPDYYYDTTSELTSGDTLFESPLPGPVDSTCEDSILSFQPMVAVPHGGRIYAIGDPLYPNRLYYSSFNRPTNWPCSSFINIPSRSTDWFVDLLALEDRLILFRQNSIVQLQGHSFYQYSLDELIHNVGLTAPRSVARVGNTVYFYHSMGVYTLSAFGGVSQQPLSFAIQKSLDSFMVNQQRAVGATIAGNYWLSIDYAGGNQKTYVYSEMPIPHWKAYGFGLHAVVQFDVDTANANYNPNKWLVALVRNFDIDDQTILYQWQEDALSGTFTRTDTVDDWSDTTHSAIIATYQSKRFFEGRERERVYWIDLVGEGDADTITFTFLDEGMAFDTVKYLPDFTDGKRDRIIVDHIVSDFTVRWQDNGYGQYTIKGYEIGWIPWDRGRPVP